MEYNDAFHRTDGIAADVAQIQRIGVVTGILEIVCDTTGMGFGAVGRVTDTSWTACAVLDRMAFGLQPGGQVDIETTFCRSVRAARAPLVIDDVAAASEYRDHPTPKFYGFRSYIAVPIVLSNGEVFGTLCAFDPQPRTLGGTQILRTMEMFAQLIAAQIDAEQRLEASRTALIDAEAVGRLREQFVGILGHDLRNPLAAVSSGLNILERTALEPKAEMVVSQMKRSCGRMHRLIDDTLDFTRGKLGGGIPVTTRPVADLASDLDGVVEEMRVAHPDADIVAAFALEVPVHCDEDRVCQLLSNLLANALTHGTADAPISVVAHSDADVFRLSVSNAGTPIPTDRMDLLFQPFTRGGSIEDGLGLGLYIGSEIARAHGGTLAATSTTDRTTFIFEMPNVPSATAAWTPLQPTNYSDA